MLTSLLARVRSFVAAIVHRDVRDREMHDEFALHIDLRANDLVRHGLSRADAERQARLEFGNVTAAQETARRAWGVAWLDVTRQDVRYALRTLRRNPVFTAVAVLSLGVGIAATTTTFSVIDALDFRPLPFANADRLVWLAEVTPRDREMCGRCPFLTASPTAAAWAAQARSLDAVSVLANGGFSWEHDDLSEPLGAMRVTPGFFAMLGVRPLIGRGFTPADTARGARPVMLVSYEFWQGRLGGDPDIVGRRLRSSDDGASSPAAATIIGVLPRGVRFRSGAPMPIWTPLALDAQSSAANRHLTVVARLRAGETIDAASAELRTITARLARVQPAAYRDWESTAQPLRNLLRMGTARSRFILFAITTLVLLVAVLNVSGLLLARVTAREQELAMRSALGAGRTRLLRQLLVEGICVSTCGGVAGVLLALAGTRFAARWISLDSSGLSATIDHRMLIFAAAVSVLTGIGAAIAPALRAASMDPGGTLRARQGDAAPSAARASNVLVMAQIAVALVLLTGASLLSRDFLELRYLDLGYQPQGLYRTTVSAVRRGPTDVAAWAALAERTRERVAGIPGVSSTTLEYINAMHPEIVRPAERPTPGQNAVVPVMKAVDAGYFTTMGTQLVAGRAFALSDGRGAPLVAIVNRAAASILWPGQNPIGRRVFVGDSGSAGEVLTVVGVAANMERGELIERHWPMVYRPMGQATIYHTVAGLWVRTNGNSPGVLPAATAAIRQKTGRAVPPFVSSEEAIGTRLRASMLNAVVLDVFACFGLLLAAMGVYGSVAFAVTRRTREIGVRMALGAEGSAIVALVARRSVLLSIGGVIVGVTGALASVRVLRSVVSGTSVMNPWIFVGSSAVMIGVALLAALIPARRATRVDAMIALRAE